ncbi:unnamed protein product [Closterium sp. Naga37s-1]|nr:unnamed protein product [Closterium sp. Naga37s-1]
MEQLDATMFAEERSIVILLDNASSHVLKSEHAESEDIFGFRTRSLRNIRLVFLLPNTTCFTQPLDQGLIAIMKARYRQHWLEARCWWCTGCLPLAWALSLAHVGAAGLTGAAPLAIDLNEEIGDVGVLIDRLALGSSAMPAADFVAINDGQPTCAEPDEDALALEPASAYSAQSWEPPATMQAVYDNVDPAKREARCTARAACEMLIGYARATCITPRELSEIHNPIIIKRMERASPHINLNTTPIATPAPFATPDGARPRPRGRVLPAWMTAPSPRQALIDAGTAVVMAGFRVGAFVNAVDSYQRSWFSSPAWHQSQPLADIGAMSALTDLVLSVPIVEL